MPALLCSSVELKRTKHRAVSVISLHEKRKLNPDGRYRVGQLLVRYQIGQTDTESERERDRDREALFLFDRLCCQLVSFPGRFIKGRNTKSSEGGRHGGEPNMPFEHIDLASLRFFGERQPECQSERMNPPPSFSYPILPDGKREREREREREIVRR